MGLNEKPDTRNVKFKKFGLQKTLDLYVFREFMLPFFVLILGFTILFLVGDIFSDLGDFLGHKGTLKQILTYFMLKMPGNIRFILPISVLLSCMYTMANFGKNLEITAMRASGVSIQRACVSIYIIAAIVAGVNTWFNETFVPYTQREAYILIKTVKTDGFYKNFRKSNLSYRSPDGKRTWLFNYFDESEIQKKIYLKRFSDDGSLKWDLKAETAEFIPGEGWLFNDGELTHFDKVNQLPGAPQRFETLRKGLDEFPETPRDILNHVKHIDDLTSAEIYEILQKSSQMSEHRENLYWTTFFYRMSFYPFASLIAALLGIPIATKNERSGIFLSIIIAVVIIVTYIVMSEMMRVMGNTGQLPPFIAAVTPTFVFLAFGWYNVVKQD